MLRKITVALSLVMPFVSNWTLCRTIRGEIVLVISNRPCVAYQSYFEITRLITFLITYIKKILYSDWLSTAQFKCNTSAISVTQVQITHRNSEL